MRKILIVFDGHHFSEGAFDFARRLNSFNPILLIGIFLPQAELAYFWNSGGAHLAPLLPVNDDNELSIVKQNVAKFERLCTENAISYNVHEDFFDFVLPELKKESRYADILIIGTESFYQFDQTILPNDFLREALHDVNCPVLLVPEKFQFPQTNILAYDGSNDAIFAIKQFAYLLPEFLLIKTILVFADDGGRPMPSSLEVEELVRTHFPNISFESLNFNPKTQFNTWNSEQPAPIVVCGSFSRSGFSQLFNRSFITEVIADHHTPIFMAHM